MFFTNLDIFKEACTRCRLVFHHDRRDFYLNEAGFPPPSLPLPDNLPKADGQLPPCRHAAALSELGRSSYPARPHEIGLFEVPDGWLAVWDGSAGGAGLVSHVGAKGQHLQMAYLVEGSRYVGIGHHLAYDELVAGDRLDLTFRAQTDDAPVLTVAIYTASLKVVYRLSRAEGQETLCDCLEKQLRDLVLPCCSLAAYTRRLEGAPAVRPEEARDPE